MQPTYLPWIGYFELINRADTFVLFDNVQFVRKSWQQRNRIKSSDGELMLSVSVLIKGEQDQQIMNARINHSDPWSKKHLKSIELNYRKSPYFEHYYPPLKKIYEEKHETLLSLNQAIIEFQCQALNIQTKIVRASTLYNDNQGDALIAGICQKLESSILYNAKGAQELIDLDYLKSKDITVQFQEFDHPEYPQQHKDFIPYLSCIDLLFNTGEQAIKYINNSVAQS